MSVLLVAAAVLALLTAAVHAWPGGREILRPTLAADELGAVVRGTLESVWHLLTWHFVVLGAALLWAVWLPGEVATVVALVAAATALGHAVVFFVVGIARFGDPWRLPQWVVFVLIGAASFAASLVGQPGATWLPGAAAALAALLLGAIAVLHLLWAMGSSFPAADRGALVAAVIGGPVSGAMPGRVATIIIAIGLIGVAWETAMLGGLVASPIPATWLRICGIAMVAIFGLRGIGGFFEVVVRPSIRGTPYMRLNRFVYSPLATVLAMLIACTLLA